MSRRRTILRRGGAMIAMLLLAVTTFGTFWPEAFLLHPSTDPMDVGRARSVLVERVDHRLIEAFVARSYSDGREPDAYVLEFTGSGSRADRNGEYDAIRWSPHRVEAWTFNYPGFGRSSGPCTLGSIAPIALEAFDHVAARAKGRPIFVCGNSFGSTVALYVGSKRPAAGLMIQSPPALREIVMSHGWWNLWLLAIPVSLQVPDALEAPMSAARITRPAVFITADDDNVVPPRFQQMTIDVYAGRMKRVHVKGKGHLEAQDTFTTPADRAAFEEAREWLWHVGVR